MSFLKCHCCECLWINIFILSFFLVNKLRIILCKYANGKGTSHSFSLGAMLWKIALYLVFIYGTDFYCHFFSEIFFGWGHKWMMSNIGTILTKLSLACKRWWYDSKKWQIFLPSFEPRIAGSVLKLSATKALYVQQHEQLHLKFVINPLLKIDYFESLNFHSI